MPQAQKPKKRAPKHTRFSHKHSPHIISFFIMAIFLGATFTLTFFLKQAQDPRASAAAQLVNCTVAAADEAIDSEEEAFLPLLNAYRQQHNLGTVSFSPNLNRAAAWMSNDMKTNNYFDHIDSLHRNPSQRIKDCGYTHSGTGENVHEGQTTAQGVINSWKASPGHNAVMLNPTYTAIGIARSGNLWTLDLGKTTDSTMPTSIQSPTQIVPSHVCGGSTNNVCPTSPQPSPTIPAPTETPPTEIQPTEQSPIESTPPIETVEPTTIDEESLSPAPEVPPSTGNQQPANGLIALLLQLLAAILGLFSALLGK